MKILSLFDGMACGLIAAKNAGIFVERYVAYEIDKYAVQTSAHNFPTIEHRGDVFKADFTEFEGFDFLIGGSPCTYWSIAQKNNRETEASGMGWELFQQYLRALHESKPRFFIYENNKSMSNAIRESISSAFGFEPICINSALVSAQTRHRLYWVGKLEANGSYSQVHIEQPEDRGILLHSILETVTKEAAYELATVGVGYRNRREDDGNLYRRFETSGKPKSNALTTVTTDSMIAEPIRLWDIGSTAQAHRVYSCNGKSVTLKAGSGGQGGKTGLYAVPCKVGELGNGGQGNRIYSIEGKSVAQTAQSGGVGSNTGLYAIPYPSINGATGPVYEVRDGIITLKGKQYPIRLTDGYYIIRKLTVKECMRLQTVPEWYEFPVSNSQAYKMLGNGWTIEVISHLFRACLTEELEEEEEYESA